MLSNVGHLVHLEVRYAHQLAPPLLILLQHSHHSIEATWPKATMHMHILMTKSSSLGRDSCSLLCFRSSARKGFILDVYAPMFRSLPKKPGMESLYCITFCIMSSPILKFPCPALRKAKSLARNFLNVLYQTLI